ncbi:MAG: SGNH/GDSL hydrolase family protein [Rikenellaceae bacterium]
MKTLILRTTLLIALFSILGSSFCHAQVRYIDAQELTLTGKNLPTSHHYHRIDTADYKGFSKYENIQVRCPAGLAIAFTTSSTRIDVKAEYGPFVYNGAGTTRIAHEGFDLYIRRGGEWVYASSLAPKARGTNLTLVNNMNSEPKECLLYLPNYSEILDLQIGVDESSTIEPLENPFRHKIVIFGSSFTHGIGTSRSGMSYPMQIARNTGLEFCSIACSGNCKMQPYFAAYLADIQEVDAFVFDAFSNPSADMIRERLNPFIETLRSSHPHTPLIFVQTINREICNFDQAKAKDEAQKQAAAVEMMKVAMAQFDDLYFIDSKGFTGDDHISSADGVHPSDLGYMRWANALQPKLLKILKKYGIK